MLNAALQESSGWRAAHEALTRLARQRAGLDFEEGRRLRAAQRARVHERLGYGSFAEYIERLFGYSPRLTFEKLRVAEALETLPQLGEALRDGSASWSCVRELTRVASRDTEAIWLNAARGQTVRDVEKLVSGHRPGDLPGDAKDWRAQRHLLRFEVSGEVLALFREALVALRRDAGGPLDDDAALLLMARQVLGGPADDARASYQIAVTVCEECARATQTGAGEAVDISTEITQMANCDAQQLTCFATSHEPGGTMPQKRASQTIPPATRRAVLRRDQHRCRVPGCRHATFVDVHHLRSRENGGGNEAGNLLTLCGAHHRACHRGDLHIERTDSGFRFQHACGSPYGEPPRLGAADVAARAFGALRKLGFEEREVRAAIQETSAQVKEDALGEVGAHVVGAHVGSHDGVETLVRTALEWLTRGTFAKAS